VVIYQENHSFDNLYGGWERVHGLAHADAPHTAQLSQGGQLYDCLLQDDVNLTSPPLGIACTETHGGAFMSAFVNARGGPPFTPSNPSRRWGAVRRGCAADATPRRIIVTEAESRWGNRHRGSVCGSNRLTTFSG
jgi:phospholipase C